MIVIGGLVVLIVAAIVGFAGALANAGSAHRLTENFAVFGYHVTGSTGTLFVFGIVIGVVAMLGLSVLLAGARRTAGRGRNARRELESSQREAAFLNQDRDRLLENQRRGAAGDSVVAATPRRRSPLLERFSRFHPRRRDSAANEPSIPAARSSGL